MVLEALLKARERLLVGLRRLLPALGGRGRGAAVVLARAAARRDQEQNG
jgi:hypothetical protein